jgi:hypothetical protein
MIALVSYLAVALVAIVAATWLIVRSRPVPVVLVVCRDGKTREIPADDPRIRGKI